MSPSKLSDTLLKRLSLVQTRKNPGFGWTNFEHTTLEPQGLLSWPIDLSFGMLSRIQMRQYKIRGVWIRQAGGHCNNWEITDIMCCDKLVFGLCDNTTRTELLKTHLRPDNTPKALTEVVAEAKLMESAQNANKLIIGTTKGTDEAVNWRGSGRSKSFRKKHRDMKLRREPNTCHWWGDMRGPHKWADCQANGRTWSKCGEYDQFASVCLEQLSLNNKPNQPRKNNNPSQRSKPNNQPIH